MVVREDLEVRVEHSTVEVVVEWTVAVFAVEEGIFGGHTVVVGDVTGRESIADLALPTTDLSLEDVTWIGGVCLHI